MSLQHKKVEGIAGKEVEMLSGHEAMAVVMATGQPIQTDDGRGSIGHTIRMLRKEKGISQEELAAKAGVNRTTIARVECGIFHTLSVAKLEAIAIAIGVDLKALLFQAESAVESIPFRGQLGRIEFSLEFPEVGFRIASFIPKRKEFFFGKIEIQAQKTIASEHLPHPEQIYLHTLEGKVLLSKDHKEYLLKTGDCFIFTGRSSYEFYNPDQLKPASALFITYPSFITI